MDRERLKQRLLEEFRKRGIRPPTWIDFIATVIIDDPRCTWSEKMLKECIEVAVDAYRDHVVEKEIVEKEMKG